jgi:hypothetical protein
MPQIVSPLRTSIAVRSTRKITGILSVFLATGLLFSAESSIAQNSALIMDSPQGDWVGTGTAHYYLQPEAHFQAQKNSANGVSVFVTVGQECWTLNFSAVARAPLTPGVYDHAVRYGFEQPYYGSPLEIDPGMDIFGGVCSAGHGCNTVSGSFEVKELVYAQDGSVMAFHATFRESCERFSPELHGEILFNSSAPIPAEHHVTSESHKYATSGLPFKYRITTSKRETAYQASGLPIGLDIDAATGLISGVPREVGEFNVIFSATGESGAIEGKLQIVVNLPGRSTGPFTAVRFVSDAGDPAGRGRHFVATVDDGIIFGTGAIFSTTQKGHRIPVSFYPWAEFENPPSVADHWTAQFQAGKGADLAPGDYQDVNEYSNLDDPDLYASNWNGNPDRTTGNFTIHDLRLDPNGQLFQMRASFVQHSYGTQAVLRGWIWYKAENVITSDLFVVGKEKQPLSYQIIANNEPTTYTANGLPAGLFLDPQSGLISGTATESGAFKVSLRAVGPSATASDTLELTINPAETLANISTRLKVGSGNNVLIGGFIITGSDAKTLVLRGIGPSLTASGVSGALINPKLELYNQAGVAIATNDDWRTTQKGGLITADQSADIETRGLAPAQDVESAIIVTLSPGNYTAIVRGIGNATGVGLVEVYDLSQGSNARLANISTRGFVENADNVMIGGFIIGGNTGSGGKVVVRGLGPSLAASGITNPLADPTLELHDANGLVLAFNNDWKESQELEIGATGLAPSNPVESTILIELPPGNSTAILRGRDGTPGIGLIEVYNIP